ncbi:MAG: UDP-glucuronic acid decarboxylase family protein [Myxococcales bacterium]
MTALHGGRAIVLGGAGFLGSHLCERLLEDGAAEVIAVDDLITGSERNLSGILGRSSFRFLVHDITERFTVPGDIHFIFNLASPASPIDYARLPLETLRAGSMGTENALRLALEKKAVFLQASTSEVYGDPLVHPQPEDYWGNVNTVGPRSCYDEAKRYGEALVSAYARVHGVETRIVRIFNTYGPRMRLDDGRVVPAFVSQVLRGEDLTVFGDGSQTRSFCYVSDLIDGIVRLALSGVRQPVNIGNPQELTILEFAEAVREAAGSRARIVHRPYPQDDPKRRKPDISRARRLLGWSPRVGLRDGLRATLSYFRDALGMPAIAAAAG